MFLLLLASNMIGTVTFTQFSRTQSNVIMYVSAMEKWCQSQTLNYMSFLSFRRNLNLQLTTLSQQCKVARTLLRFYV